MRAEQRVGRTMGWASLALIGAGVALRHRSRSAGEERGLRVRHSVTVNRSPQEIYARWRDLSRLPEFMWHLESVEQTGEGRSRWVARGPAGTRVEWDAELTRDEPGEALAWRSVGRTRVPNRGEVRFRRAPKGTGTEVTVELLWSMRGRRVAAALAKLFGEEPEQQVRDALRRFKQVVETGEVARSDAVPDGTRSARQLHLVQRPGQPQEQPQEAVR